MPRIMIVDTDDEHREILCGTVKGKGVVVEEVVDGYEALAKFRADPPDAVVMAVELSNDLDGVECLGRMKALNNRFIPVILIGESDDPQKTVQALLAGAADYVTKPYAPIVLRTRLRSALVTQMRFDQLAERNREVIQLAHVMACDLEDPLQDLVKAVRGLRAELGDSDPADTVSQISADTMRVANVMHDMMVYASAGAEQLERNAINMGDVVRRAVEPMKVVAENKDVFLEVECMDEQVFVHEQVIARIVSTMIENAIHFVEGETDGRVRVSVRGDQGVVEPLSDVWVGREVNLWSGIVVEW